jgi:hypothetical protein
MKNSLFISQEYENKLIHWIKQQIRNKQFINEKTAIVQLSYEYSGILAQRLSHLLSTFDRPLDIEPINIPYKNEFKVFVNPNIMDNYEKFIIVDSGCLSGNNFKNVLNIFLDYGIKRENIILACEACDLNSITIPDLCPLYFDGSIDMVHFWWETKTNKFGA